MTAPMTPVPVVPVVPVLTPDTGTPAWLTHAITIAIPLVGFAVSIWHPRGTLDSAGAQAAVILGALALAAAIHIAQIVTKNGLTKVGLEKTVSQTEAWVHDNWATIQADLAAAQPVLQLLPQYHRLVTTVAADVAAVKARVDAIPADQTAAAVAALRAALPGMIPAAPPPVAA